MTYCIASEALLYPFNQNNMEQTVFNSIKRAYLNVFGDINPDGMDVKLVEGKPYLPRCTGLPSAALQLFN